MLSIADVAAPQLPDSGDFVYRVSQPLRALGAVNGVQTVSFTTASRLRERLYRDADVLVIQMVGDADLLPVVIERRKARRLTVFEVSDNFMDFQRTNPASAFYEDPYNRACLLQLLTLCHGMQTTMPELEKRFSKYSPDCAVFMNNIEKLGDPYRTPGRLTVGWGGSAGHYNDVAKAASHIISWLSRRPEVHFAIMANPAITALFDAVPLHRKTLHKPGSLDDYYAFVQTLDIGLAIAEEEEFNLCRSDVKFMEYASRGVAPVCSNVPTYSRTVRNGITGFLYSSFDEMCDILDRLASDPAQLRLVSQSAYNYIRDERSEKGNAHKRLEYYSKLIAKNKLEARGPVEWVPGAAGAEKADGSNYYHISFGRVESLLYNGLISQFHNGDVETAMNYFSEAAELDRDFYPPHFYLGNALAGMSPDAASREYEAAAKANPAACAAPLMHARLKAAAGDTETAIKILHRLQSKRPEFAPGWALEGDIYSSMDRDDQALPLYGRAMEENPYYAPAAIMAGGILLERNDYEGAAVFLRKAVEVVPRSAAGQTALAAALYKTGYPDEAVDRLRIALDSAPSHADAARLFIEIAKTAYKEGRYDRSSEYLGWICTKRPEDVEAAFWFARSLERSAGPESAAALWRKVVELDKDGNFSEIAAARLEQI